MIAPINLHLCRAFRLGFIDYEESFRLQNHLAQARREGQIEDVLLLLQHSPVITMGKSGKVQNVLAAPTLLQDKGIKMVYTDRGGDVTYHGPGQLVAYPIFNLRLHGLGVPDYVWKLEEVVIRLLVRYGIAAGRVPKLRGVWVEHEKICSLGVHLSRWVSKHGLALNVNTNLDPFHLINPCGLTNCQVTSMAKKLGRNLSMEEIESAMLQSFAEVFSLSLREDSPRNLEPYR